MRWFKKRLQFCNKKSVQLLQAVAVKEVPVSQKLVSVCSWHFCIPSPIIYKVMHFASSKHLAPCNYERMQWHFILSCANSKIHPNRKAHSRNSVIWNERIKNVRHGRIRFLTELSLFVQCSSVIFVCYKNGVLILYLNSTETKLFMPCKNNILCTFFWEGGASHVLVHRHY